MPARRLAGDVAVAMSIAMVAICTWPVAVCASDPELQPRPKVAKPRPLAAPKAPAGPRPRRSPRPASPDATAVVPVTAVASVEPTPRPTEPPPPAPTPTPPPPARFDPATCLGPWTWACGNGQRRGTMNFTTIRPDGKLVGTVSSPGINGRVEAMIKGDTVDVIMRWSVLFVHGRVHAVCPVEHLRRRPIHLQGTWEGTNLEGLSDDFEATKL